MVQGYYDGNYDPKQTYEQIKVLNSNLADVLDKADGKEQDGITKENLSIFMKAVDLINQDGGKKDVEEMCNQYSWLKNALDIVGKEVKELKKVPGKIKEKISAKQYDLDLLTSWNNKIQAPQSIENEPSERLVKLGFKKPENSPKKIAMPSFKEPLNSQEMIAKFEEALKNLETQSIENVPSERLVKLGFKKPENFQEMIVKLKEDLNNPEAQSDFFPSGITQSQKERMLKIIEEYEKYRD